MWLIFLSERYASTCTQICTFEADLQSQAGLARSDVGSPDTVNVADVSLTTAKDDGVSVCSLVQCTPEARAFRLAALSPAQPG